MELRTTDLKVLAFELYDSLNQGYEDGENEPWYETVASVAKALEDLAAAGQWIEYRSSGSFLRNPNDIPAPRKRYRG